jgi:hypothetical protein
MTNKISTLMRVLIISLAAILFIPTMSVYALTTKNQAPNMYIDWPDNGDYDMMMVDWYCEADATNTYWAVHNWNDAYGGYAGFQNKDGNHVLLLAKWDGKDQYNNTITPTIDYLSPNSEGDTFSGEGSGKHIFTNYNWQAGRWYTMCIGTRTVNNKTQYAQWIREGNGAWLLTGIISYPEANHKFDCDSVFQEDFMFNNYSRKCRVRNAYGRSYGTNNWESWSSGTISNSYFPYTESTWEDGVQTNVDFDNDWGTSSDNSYAMIQSGGYTSSTGKQLPFVFTLSQPSSPAASSPVWPAP